MFAVCLSLGFYENIYVFILSFFFYVRPHNVGYKIHFHSLTSSTPTYIHSLNYGVIE